MGLNVVLNSNPGQGVALSVYKIPAELNTPNPISPPGSIGVATSPVSGQLTHGNPGGIGVSFGLGITTNNVA